MSYVGVNIGALTAKVVRADAKKCQCNGSSGAPLGGSRAVARDAGVADAEYFAVSGIWATSLAVGGRGDGWAGLSS